MNILVTASCFTAGHALLPAGTKINLPLADAVPLIGAGRAQPADDAAKQELRDHNERQLRQADRFRLGRR